MKDAREDGQDAEAVNFSTRLGMPGSPLTRRRVGRPPGARNKVTSEAREFATRIVESPEYRDMLMLRAVAGELQPAVECMLWYYAYGKPAERVDVTFQERVAEYEGLSDEELARRAEDAAREIRMPVEPSGLPS